MNIKSNFRSVAFLCYLSLVSSLLAAGPYLTAGKPDGIALLPPPPAAGSAEQAADLASSWAIFQTRTPEQEAIANKEDTFNVYCFAPTIGPSFQPNHFPKTDAFFADIEKETKAVAAGPKNKWQRPRPFLEDKRLLVGEPEKGFSYPSGHSTIGTVESLILADLFPDKRDAILATGRDAGWHRVLMGKHYPTDIYAGRVLGQAIVRELKSSAAFQHDFDEVKAELSAAQHGN